MKKALSLFLATLLVLSTMSCLSVVSFAADELTEIESNDIYQDAQEIIPEETTVGTITSSEDADWYKFTSDKDYFYIDFGIHDPIETRDYYWTVTIYDSNLKIIQYYENKRELTSVKIPLNGTIYVLVESYKNWDCVDDVYYDINATTVEDALWENELNNTSASATAMTIGKTYTGSLNHTTETTWHQDNDDWYKFTSDKDYFVVDFAIYDQTVECNYYWTVTIYDSNLKIIQQYKNTRELVSVKNPLNGTIYVQVEPHNDWDDVDNTYYKIKAKTVTDALWENELNDTSATATAMTIGKTYTGSLNHTTETTWHQDNDDWYKFTSDKDYFVLNLAIYDQTVKCNYYWTVTIYDSNINQVAQYINVSDLTTSKIPLKGTVYVQVEPYKDWDDVDNIYYKIKASTVESGNWETEHNNTSTTADIIKQGTTYKGTISSTSSDVDFYKFTSTSSAFKLKFTIDLSTEDVDNIKEGWKVTVYPSDSASNILGEYVVNSNGTFETRVLPYEKGKTYFVKIQAANTSYAPIGEVYKFAVVDATGGNKWEVENGKTDLPNATTIANGTKIYGNFYNGNDIDYYKLAVPASGKLNIKFNRTESELTYNGWKLLILDAVGSVIEEFDLGNSLNATINSKTLPKQGNYYVKIQPNNSYYAPSSDINYNLTIKYTMTTPTISSISNGTSGVSLKWTAVKDCAKYEVYRSTTSTGSYTKIATITNYAKNTYTDKAAVSGKKYFYKIKAIDGSYTSTSAAKSITFLKVATAKSVANSTTGVTVTWTAVSGATGYEIYRATGNGSFTKIVTVKSQSVVKFTDKSAKSGTTYKYKVRAYVGTSTKGAFSAVKSITFVAAPTAKAASSSKTGITYTWTPVTGVNGYQVYRATGSGSYTKIATVKGATSAKYVDKTAKKGTTYKYKIRAYKGNATSAFSTKVISIKDKY